MRKLRILITLTALILVFAVITACRNINEQPPESIPEPAQTTEPAPENTEETSASDTITLQWAVGDVRANNYYAPLIEAYKEIAPHITVELVELGVDNWNNAIMTHLIGGHVYDLIYIQDIIGYMMHVNADTLLPLNDKVIAGGIDVGDLMGIPEQFMIDGSYYALPFICDFWVVFYNKDIFSVLNEHESEDEIDDEIEYYYPSNEMTFETWTEIIKEAASGSGDDKIWGNFFQDWRSSTTLFGILDGYHTINDGNYNFLKPYYEAVLELEDGRYIPRKSEIAADDMNYNDVWLSGKTAQLNMGTWFISGAVNSGFSWGLASSPVPASANYGNTFGHVTQLAIPRSANYPEEAMNFIAFVTGEKGAQIIASTGKIPVIITDEVIDTLLEIPGFPQDEISKGALRPKKLFLEQPPNNNAGEISAVLNEIHNEIMNRSISVDDGIDRMNERVGALLR